MTTRPRFTQRSSPRPGGAASWFAVVPDTPAGAALAARETSTFTPAGPALPSSAGETGDAQPPLRASGRPWLVGAWPAGGLVTAAVGSARLALLGTVPLDPALAWDWLARARRVEDLDQLTARLPGSWHLVAELEGHTRVQGTASGLRRVFHARLADGTTVAGDRADIIADLAGLDEIDPTALALWLLDPVAPHPLDDRQLWRGVTAVAPDHWLRVEAPAAGGQASHRRWWWPPEPTLGLRDGAAGLRDALIEAVDIRTAAGGVVTADLSGGHDSTALCFLAAASPATVIPCTGIGRDPGDDVARWAATARAALLGPDACPGSAFELLPREQVPLVYDGIATADEPLDRPFVGVIGRAKLLAGLRLAARHEPRLHLCALGGDEIAEGSPNHLAQLVRAHPLTAYAQLRVLRAEGQWRLAGSLATLRPRPYRDWLADFVWPPASLQARAWTRLAGPPVAELDWSVPPRLPAWLTPDAVDLVRAAVAAVAATARPLAATRDRHADLWTVRVGAAVARGFAQLATTAGLPLELPFYDDRVVEAALAVRPVDRSSPWEYKPLLTRAMRPLVPEACLRRTTRAEGSAEEEAGLRANQEALRALFTVSRLAELGLVDEERLLGACRYSPTPDLPYGALQQTAAAESWLRSRTAAVPGSAAADSRAA
jgi:asparagine synthase (glutamine-hydrolysing)